MMRKEYKLSHFFMLYTLLVLGLVAFVFYGRRSNAPSNVYKDGQDVSAPFYENPIDAEQHHPGGHTMESEGEHGDEGHGDEHGGGH